MELPKNLKKDIWEYCMLNDITDIDSFIIKMITQGYTIEKYGSTPFKSENIKEVIKEVPVEIIKEVIVEKEVPVEIIKEVIVEKEVFIEKNVTNNDYICDINDEINKLKQKLESLELENLELNNKLNLNNSNDTIKELERSVENLKIELELEKNRKITPPKIEKPVINTNKNNIINWVPKEDREINNLYEE